ncbi:hypothetical protein WICANDRAFT_64298 [Wickerhamomyces anomalus NRRL Y-366-8]|uniref:CUE domain-containing protein n=1 Tax=Wickerhamomyces anomalus (strain ATCC 58044 / CBS 1984 / NCYC 433 / NRRL Y-366-8) TaxID=683960 RepID=A0A1E3NZN0_WICAA|nr:uncharacterized protein WICANDRAFT_64298 [Wickerhamomyces anomalus NRRL Y-366-8]ODQ58152.1 hypothetical protein WICANDRAFT_64298 [Wickerhamomyces anomalus NRRL Y-366-8]
MAKGNKKSEEKVKDATPAETTSAAATGEQEEGIILNDDLSDEEVEKEKKEVKEELAKEDEEKEEIKKEELKEEPKKVEKEEKTEAIIDEKKEDIAKEPTSTTKDDEGPPPPPKPIRPLSPRQEAKKNLKDAFPTVEDSTIEAILIASSFKLEPAFNAMLYLSDPTAMKFEEVPIVEEAPTPRRQLTQLEQDEMLAKKLDEEFNKSQRRRHRHHQEGGQYPGEGQPPRGAPRRSQNVQDEDEDDDMFSNFVEKDLPQIKEQFSKNLEETKTKFNSWVSGWKKQYQTTSEEWQQRNRQQGGGFGQQQQPKSQQRRRYEFEQDPEEVDVRDFHGISLGNNDDEDEEDRPKLPNRNRAQSTDLYGTPKHGSKPSTTTSTGGGAQNKWEPLQTKKPDPISSSNAAEDDDDFLLSDDELLSSSKKN